MNFYNSICQWISDFVPKQLRYHLARHPLLGYGLFLISISVYLFLGQLNDGSVVFIQTESQTAQTVSSPLSVGGADHSVLGGDWSEKNHEALCDYNVVQLKRNAKDAIIDYNEQISLGQSTVEFIIVPIGKYAHNIGYGRRTLYEFMFGDGDKQKVSLKYDADQDGNMEFVPLFGELPYSEAAQGVFVKEIAESSEIKVRVEEVMVEDTKIQLLLVINEKYSFTSAVLPLINSSQYKRVYISLVDYSEGGDNQTGAEFPELRVCPLV